MKTAGALAVACVSPLAWAAGGHHAVDDAMILAPGQCEAETWIEHARGEGSLLHAGPGCRVGPLELSGAIERTGTERSASVQVKGAWPLNKTLSVGASIAPFIRRGPERDDGTAVVLLATWALGPWSAHANLGREFAALGDGPKSGASLEWTGGGWTWTGERYTSQAGRFVRAGARWQASRGWTLDASHARRVHGPGASSWTFGSTWGFAAP